MRGLREEDWATDPWVEEVPERRSFVEVLSAPPGWPFNLWVLAMVALVLHATTTPGWRWGPLLLASPVLLLLGFAWVVRFAAHLLLGRGGARQPIAFLVAPVVVVVAAALVRLEVPLRLVFEPNRARFTEVAEQVVQEAAADPDAAGDVDRRIGPFELTRARVFDDGVVLFDAEGAFFDDAGFAYFPDGGLPEGDGTFESPRFRSLGGGWYAFTSSW